METVNKNKLNKVRKSSLDCVSEEVRGAPPSLISLMVSVDVKPYVLQKQTNVENMCV